MSTPTKFPSVEVTWINDVPFGAARETTLLLDACFPSHTSTTPRPAVLWVHGNGWSAGHRCDDAGICQFFAHHGFFAVTMDYRLSQQATFPAQIHDVKAAIRWVRANASTYAIDPQHIGIAGFSAGGMLAALAGLSGDKPELEGTSGSPGYSSRVQAVAIGAAPADFLDYTSGEVYDFLTHFFDGTQTERADRWRLASPIYHVHRGAPPFLIAHGTDDELVPFAQAARLAQALQAIGVEVEFLPIAGVDHNWKPPQQMAAEGRRSADLEHLALPFFQRHFGQ
jgi:acetyl esterase/lipase